MKCNEVYEIYHKGSVRSQRLLMFQSLPPRATVLCRLHALAFQLLHRFSCTPPLAAFVGPVLRGIDQDLGSDFDIIVASG